MNNKQAAEAMLDKIEKWLKESPTQPHIEYNLIHKFRHRIEGDATEDLGVQDMSARAMEVWDTEAMLAEWSSIREDLLRPIEEVLQDE